MGGTAREEASARHGGSRKQELGRQWVGACGGGRRGVGMGKRFVTCDPLHKECNGNPEPRKNGRKNSVEKLGKPRELCDPGESRKGGAGGAIMLSSSGAAIHQRHTVSFPHCLRRPARPACLVPTFWLAALRLLSPQIAVFTALLPLCVCFDCIWHVSTHVRLTKEFLRACCKTSRQRAQLRAEEGWG